MDVDRDGTVMIQTQDGQVYHVAPSQMRGYRLLWGEKVECVITHGNSSVSGSSVSLPAKDPRPCVLHAT